MTSSVVTHNNGSQCRHLGVGIRRAVGLSFALLLLAACSGTPEDLKLAVSAEAERLGLGQPVTISLDPRRSCATDPVSLLPVAFASGAITVVANPNGSPYYGVVLDERFANHAELASLQTGSDLIYPVAERVADNIGAAPIRQWNVGAVAYAAATIPYRLSPLKDYADLNLGAVTHEAILVLAKNPATGRWSPASFQGSASALADDLGTLNTALRDLAQATCPISTAAEFDAQQAAFATIRAEAFPHYSRNGDVVSVSSGTSTLEVHVVPDIQLSAEEAAGRCGTLDINGGFWRLPRFEDIDRLVRKTSPGERWEWLDTPDHYFFGEITQSDRLVLLAEFTEETNPFGQKYNARHYMRVFSSDFGSLSDLTLDVSHSTNARFDVVCVRTVGAGAPPEANEASQPPAAPPFDPNIFVQRVKECWSVPVGAAESGTTVQLRIEFNRDGSIAHLSNVGAPSTETERRLFSSALRAVARCAPYELPEDEYDSWREVTLTMDPRG